MVLFHRIVDVHHPDMHNFIIVVDTVRAIIDIQITFNQTFQLHLFLF